MSHISTKTENELILRRRKKIRIKRAIMLMVFLIALFFILCLKLPYFNIKYIKVYGNKSISSNSIIKDSKVYGGSNIFYTNLKDASENILENPYIEDVDIARELPGTININVKEREATFYIESSKKYFIIDKNGVLLQRRDNINNMKLVKLNGIDCSKVKVGECILNKNDNKIKAVTTLGSIIQNNKLPFEITYIDVSNSVDIKIYFKDMCVELGQGDNLGKKVNRALNIMLNEKLGSARGYIDVRFDGNPVFHIEN